MSENQELEPIAEQDVWERMDGEPNRWFSLFTEYRLMGPSRTITKFYRAKREQQGKAQPPPGSGISNVWLRYAREWKWRERAQAWDEVMLETREDEAIAVFTTGLALSHERINRLSKVAVKLEGYILDPATKRPSPYVIEQYRGILDDIAKEKGERNKEVRFTGAKGGPIVIETSWGRGGTASDAWDTKQLPSPLEAVVVSEIQESSEADDTPHSATYRASHDDQ